MKRFGGVAESLWNLSYGPRSRVAREIFPGFAIEDCTLPEPDGHATSLTTARNSSRIFRELRPKTPHRRNSQSNSFCCHALRRSPCDARRSPSSQSLAPRSTNPAFPRSPPHNSTRPITHRPRFNTPGRAGRIVPVILAVTGPMRSVVDVGGGDGGWLSIFQKCGTEEVLLIDCPEAEMHLLIERDCFLSCDLSRELPKSQRFDLAVCLECAEHLPEHRAEPLVEWLTLSADLVVFSAAIPGQGGKGHINEKSSKYWSDLFLRHGFQRHDVLRPRIIHDQSVPWWYRQNLFLFRHPTTQILATEGDFLPKEFCLIHRDLVDRIQTSPGFLRQVQTLGLALMSAIQKRIGRFRVRGTR